MTDQHGTASVALEVRRAITRGEERRTVSIVGESPALTRQLAALREFAVADAPVHIYGETGTGKELVAVKLHELSGRLNQKFIAQNCAAIPDTLLQSLLFGHRRGAFTGADRDQVGVFEAADGGTLLLDEIAELSPAVQSALLRVLQDGELTPLGEVRARRVNVRIISASNQPLEEQVAKGRFRRDLYFRLVTLRIDLPTLSQRRSDVPLLVKHFVHRYNLRTRKGILGVEPAALSLLEAYAWPGNVRQLQAEVERACILTAAGAVITSASLSAHVQGERAMGHAAADLRQLGGRSLPDMLGDIERSLLCEALSTAGGNRTAAARLLGISRQRLSQRLEKWRLSVDARGVTR